MDVNKMFYPDIVLINGIEHKAQRDISKGKVLIPYTEAPDIDIGDVISQKSGKREILLKVIDLQFLEGGTLKVGTKHPHMLTLNVENITSQAYTNNAQTVISSGESDAVEFKATLRTNLHSDKPDKRMELSVLKTLAGFLNTNGGTLIVGVSDDGTPVGIEVDKFPNEDKMNLHLVNIINSRMGPQSMIAMHTHFQDYKNSRVLVVNCVQSQSPVFVKDGDVERFYIRTGPATTELQGSQMQDYIRRRFKQ